MKFSSRLVVGAALSALAIPAAAQRLSNDKRPENARPDADQPVATSATTTTGKKVNVSREAQKAIIDLQNAVNAKDTASIPAKLAAAQAAAKTNDDRFIIASLQTKAAIESGDLNGIKAGVAALEASGGVEPADLSLRYADLGKRFMVAKQMAEANAALDKAMALDPNNTAALSLAADVKGRNGDKAGSVALMQKSFAAARAAGKPVPENNFKFAAGEAFDIKSPAAVDIARQWASAYPSPDSWRGAVQIYRGINSPRGQQLVDIMRLARAAKALKGEADYHSYLGALVAEGELAEAKAVLAEAATQPNVDMTKTQFKDIAAKTAKAPALAAIQAQAKAATTPAALMEAGDALYGVGAYAEAATTYRAALAKGADANLANLHLGMALARAGDKAGAQVALKAAGGSQAAIAAYWLAWIGA